MKVPTELLPCPFCGETPVLNHGATDDFDVVCRNRECFGPRTSAFGFSEDAIAAWNRRAPSSELLELREAVKATTGVIDQCADVAGSFVPLRILNEGDRLQSSLAGDIAARIRDLKAARSLQSHNTGEA